jgi:uncharacterized membrane protein YqaE (UPF0057 family)
MPPGGFVKVLEIILAVFLPPIAVFVHKGLGGKFVLSILLTLLGHLPGVVYALYVTTQE